MNRIDQIQTAEVEDLEAIMALVDQENWQGYHINDLKLALNISPEHCFVLRQEKIVASCFSIVSNGVAYISYLIVKKAHRNASYGRELGLHCLTEAIKKAQTVIIYANKNIVDTYIKYGFKRLYEVKRFNIIPTAKVETTSNIKLEKTNLASITNLLKTVYANERGHIFQELLKIENFDIYLHCDEENNADALVGLFKLDKNSLRIGPLLASNRQAGIQLLEEVIWNNKHKRAFCESGTERFKQMMKESSLEYEELNVAVNKMYLGNPQLLEHPEFLLIEGGHHFS